MARKREFKEEEYHEWLGGLERRFLSLGSPLTDPDRLVDLPRLAGLSAQVGNLDDAARFWLQALWETDLPPPEWLRQWFRAEGLSSKQGVQETLERLLGEDTDTSARQLVVWILGALQWQKVAEVVRSRLPEVVEKLRQQEHRLPIRGVWLEWVTLARVEEQLRPLLAEARERVLVRLYTTGLNPDQEWPTCLRQQIAGKSLRHDWLLELHQRVHAWLRRESPSGLENASLAYADLIFSFGLARLGESEASRDLLGRAGAALGKGNEVEQFLLNAYHYRITQVLEGKPHAGPLPAEQLEKREQWGRPEMNLSHYAVDRLREHSRILEPNQRIDPYRHWSMLISDLARELGELADINDGKEVIARVQRLLRDLPRGAKNAEPRARILRSALDHAPRISEDFAREILNQVIPAYDALLEAGEDTPLMELAKFLEKALAVAAHFDRIEHIHQLVSRFQALLQAQGGHNAIQALESLAGHCFRGLRKLGMRKEIDQMLTLMANVILRGSDLQHIDSQQVPVTSLQALLHVASGWFYIGQDRQGESVMQAVRSLLFREELNPREKKELACVYAATVVQAQVEVAQKRLEELFQKLSGVRDNYTTKSYYSLLLLDVVESVVLAAASDDFKLGTKVRLWLEDDEFMVRRRIHRDMRDRNLIHV